MDVLKKGKPPDLARVAELTALRRRPDQAAFALAFFFLSAQRSFII